MEPQNKLNSKAVESKSKHYPNMSICKKWALWNEYVCEETQKNFSKNLNKFLINPFLNFNSFFADIMNSNNNDKQDNSTIAEVFQKAAKRHPDIEQFFVDDLEVLYKAPDFPGDQPPLLFVHGAFSSAWCWVDTFMPYFAKLGHPCYALSLRCHGNSKSANSCVDWVSISDYVDDVEKVLNKLKEKEETEPFLVAHSMGGFIAQKFLERQPSKGVILLCSVPPQGLVASQMSLLTQQPHIWAQMNSIMGMGSNNKGFADKKLVRELFHSNVSDEFVEELSLGLQMESHRAIWDMSMFSLPQLRLINKSPMLIVGADNDVLIPAFLVKSTGQVYNLPVHIFEEMGHFIMYEDNWQQVANTIHDWIVEQK